MSSKGPLEIQALADVLHASGETYLKEGDFARAAEFLEKSLEIRERLDDPAALARCSADLGRVLLPLGRIDEATARVERAISIQETLSDTAGLASSHEILGNIARGRGHPDDAEAHFGRALALKRAAGDEPGMAATLALFGILHTERGNYAAAEERYRAALAIFERVGDDEQVASLTTSLGTVFLRRGDLNAAVEQLERARDLFESLGDRRGFGRCLNNLASIYRSLGKDTKAAETFRLALGLFEDMGDKQSAAVAVNNLAVIEQDFGHFREASQLHQRSLELKRDLGDRSGEAVSLGNLGDIAFFRGDWDQAGRLYRQAYAIQEDVGSKRGLAWLDQHMARLSLECGRLDRAAKESSSARARGRELKSLQIQAEAILTEIRLALADDDVVQARRLLDEAEELTKKVRSRELEAFVREVRGEVLAAEGDPEGADLALDETVRAFRRLRRAFDVAAVDLTRGRAWARAGRGDRAVEPLLRAERALDELESTRHLVRPLRESLALLERIRPREGKELAELGVRVAQRLRDEDALATFERHRDRIAASTGREHSVAKRVRDLADFAHRLLGRADPERLPEKVLELLVDRVRGDRGLLLLSKVDTDEMEIFSTPGFEDPALTDATRTAERVAETGETIRDRRGGDRSAPRSRLVLPFGGADAALSGVVHVEASVGAHGFSEDDQHFAAAWCSVFALALSGSDAPREERVRVRAREPRGEFPELVGESKRMTDVFDTIRKVAPGNATILLLGESGTGKELLAHAVHRVSPRRDRPFIAVNCPSIPRELLESELFGYERGAFTGADQAKEGRIELADGGTLFLDELGDLSLSAQAKVLRVLQERTFERLGGLETIEVDVRVLAATSVDLAAAVRERRFREDLYYRLNVVPIVVPALRDRPEDVPALVDHFLRKHSPPHRPVTYVTPEALRILATYPWPGNVRELENAMQYAVNLMDGDVVRPGDLPATLRSHRRATSAGMGSLQSEVERLERDLIVEALEETSWNRSEAARRLGTNESLIRARMKKLGIAPPKASRSSRRIPRRTREFGKSDEA